MSKENKTLKCSDQFHSSQLKQRSTNFWQVFIQEIGLEKKRKGKILEGKIQMRNEKYVRDGFVASINNWYSWTDYANYDIWVCGASPCWIVIDQTTQITGVFRQASEDLGYGIVLASLYMSSYSISIIYCIIAASFKWPFALVIQNVLNSVYILIHPRSAIHPAIA